jgi:PAS domain S-box-containing protein
MAVVADTTDDAIVTKDLSGTIVSWNPGAERMYGYWAEEIIGKPVTLLVPPDQMDQHSDLMTRVAAGERVGPCDAVRTTKYGRRVDVSLAVTPIRDDAGAVAGAVAITRDITAERRAQQDLRNGESRWRAIVNAAVDGIIVIDRRGKIESFNAAAERLFEYRAAEAIGQNVSILMPMSYAREHDHYLKRYVDTREARIIGIGREVTGRRKDGTTFPMHLSVGEASIDGETKFMGIVRDLTERVAMEGKLRQESSLARIGELAAVLAHEVKNPLAAVSGAIQMIRGQLPAGSEERDILKEVLARIDGLSDLMSDLLLYARPPQPRATSLDSAEVVSSVVRLFKSDPNWAEITIAVVGHTAPIHADPQLVMIALQNLLMNAVQAMRGRGEVTVHLHESDGHAHFDIVDSGPGIPAEARDKVFTPFFTTKARGTGLGLATAQRIAESHEGRVEILQSSEEGTTMRLTLPLSPSEGA